MNYHTITYTEADETFVLVNPEAPEGRRFHDVRNGELRPFLYTNKADAEAALKALNQPGAALVTASIESAEVIEKPAAKRKAKS